MSAKVITSCEFKNGVIPTAVSISVHLLLYFSIYFFIVEGGNPHMLEYKSMLLVRILFMSRQKS